MRAPPTTPDVSSWAWDPDFAARSPWLRPAALAAPGLSRFVEPPSLETITEIVEARRREIAPTLAPIRFVEQPPKPRRKSKANVDVGALYDVRITRDGEVPSRPRNAHDFWNAIAWLLFPQTKRAIHARQCRALVDALGDGATRLPNARSRERDALTILDEGGLVIVATEGAARRIAGDRFESEVESALAAGDACLVVLGHAVLEHVSRDAPPVLALSHVVAIGDHVPDDALAVIALADRALARDVEDPRSFLAPEAHGSLWLHPDGSARPVARRAR